MPLTGPKRSVCEAERSELVSSEQVKLLYASIPFTLIGGLAAAGLLVWVQWPVVVPIEALLWMSGIAAVAGLRGLQWFIFRRCDPAPHEARKWADYFLLGASAAGLMWGLAALYLCPEGLLDYQLRPALILIGVAALISTALSAVWSVVPAFLVPCLAPWALRFIWIDTAASVFLGVVIIVFVFGLLVSSRRLHDRLCENISLRIEVAEGERSLRESEERYRQIFEHMPLGVIHYDPAGVIVDCNDHLPEILGVPRDTLIGLNTLGGWQDGAWTDALRASLNDGVGTYRGDFKLPRCHHSAPLRAFFRSIRAADDCVVGGVAIVEDCAEERRSRELIQHQAHYDSLTGLPNRKMLLECLDQALVRCRHRDSLGALITLDLDNFRNINDACGHAAGDELLKQTATRLNIETREEDTVARASGDEFALLITDVGHSRSRAAMTAQQLAERVQDLLSTPYRIDGNELHVTPSIGVAIFPMSEDSPQDVMQHADTALNRAKQEGRRLIRFYLQEMQADLDDRLGIEKDLRKALECEDFELHFQPQVDENGTLIGAEALLRWHHSERGFVSPQQFIPIAEETGLILPIGSWVMREACRELKALERISPGARALTMAVNVSPLQFRKPDFVAEVSKTINEFQIDPRNVTIEVTEGTLVEDVADTVTRMEQLRDLGVRFSIDDFGTGYSSLAYLKRLPVDVLKIDRSFVRDIGRDANDAAIVQAIIAMANHLGLRVVAEGVETQEQLVYLREHGCCTYQGYYFSAAVPSADFRKLVGDSGDLMPSQDGASAPVLRLVKDGPGTPSESLE